MKPDNSFSIELKNDTLDCIYNIVKIDSFVIHATITTCNSLHVSTEKLAESLSLDFSRPAIYLHPTLN
ncbi:MAG: hypothetical protein WAL42_04970, partial [Nitrososphaeraceae archaeon]